MTGSLLPLGEQTLLPQLVPFSVRPGATPKKHLVNASAKNMPESCLILEQNECLEKMALSEELDNGNSPDAEVPESADGLHQLLREGLRAGNRARADVSVCRKGVPAQKDAGGR